MRLRWILPLLMVLSLGASAARAGGSEGSFWSWISGWSPWGHESHPGGGTELFSAPEPPLFLMLLCVGLAVPLMGAARRTEA